MRIYTNLFEAMRETERDLMEMGIEVASNTMQDKNVKGNSDYITKEVQGYAFKLVNWKWDGEMAKRVMEYFFKEKGGAVLTYVLAELRDRVSGVATNPGQAYTHRKNVWDEFLHNGKFAYTYSERLAPQIKTILEELVQNPESRQAILNIHSNICPSIRNLEHTGLGINLIEGSADLANRGGGGRIPCSMYYQIMVRKGRVDLIYTMRSCDLLTHFPVDICLAALMQDWFADQLGLEIGMLTYFAGSLHAYNKDLKVRGIF